MSKYFHIEPMEHDPKKIRVYSKDTDSLPITKDWDQRYCSFSTNSQPVLDDIHNFEVRPDDVWLVTQPKCGSTWMAELLWLMVNDFDYKTAYTVDQEERCKLLEYSAILPALEANSLELIGSARSPRFMRSHLPMHVLPKGLWSVKPKIIYVTRDPKDAIVSKYHHFSNIGQPGSLNDFAESTLCAEGYYDPFWPHVLEFWSIRNEPWIFFTSFERMKRDLRSVVIQVAELLQKDISEDEMTRLLDHLSFDKMKNNLTCSHRKESKEIREAIGVKQTEPFRFIRKGEVGSYKDELSKTIVKKIIKWTEVNLRDYGATLEEVLLN